MVNLGVKKGTPKILMTATEVAEMTGVSRESIIRYCQKGQLPSFKFGGVWAILFKDYIEEKERKNK